MSTKIVFWNGLGISGFPQIIVSEVMRWGVHEEEHFSVGKKIIGANSQARNQDSMKTRPVPHTNKKVIFYISF